MSAIFIQTLQFLGDSQWTQWQCLTMAWVSRICPQYTSDIYQATELDCLLLWSDLTCPLDPWIISYFWSLYNWWCPIWMWWRCGAEPRINVQIAQSRGGECHNCHFSPEYYKILQNINNIGHETLVPWHISTHALNTTLATLKHWHFPQIIWV